MFLLKNDSLIKFTSFLLKLSQYGISKCYFVPAGDSGIYVICFVPKNVYGGFQRSLQKHRIKQSKNRPERKIKGTPSVGM